MNDYQKLLNSCREYRDKLDEAFETNDELHERLSTIYAERDELQEENAKLREALEDVMTESDEQVIWRMARAALERKEAQP